VRLCDAQIIFVGWVNLGESSPFLIFFVFSFLFFPLFTWKSCFFFFFSPSAWFSIWVKKLYTFLNLVNRQYRIHINFLNYPFALRPKRTFPRTISFRFYLKFQCSNIHEHFLGEISSGILSSTYSNSILLYYKFLSSFFLISKTIFLGNIFLGKLI
jgi:hypothetical protein